MTNDMQSVDQISKGLGKQETFTVLFVCVHNAGRSIMAEALFNSLAKSEGINARAFSAGTQPGTTVNPIALQVLAENNIPTETATPKLLTPELASSVDRIISMGCGIDSGICPAGRYITEDWTLDDPAGKDLPFVRAIFTQIRTRVEQLLDSLR